MKAACRIFFATILAAPLLRAEQPETSHLAFVTEYIRELAAFESVRSSAEQETKQGTGTEPLLNGIHGGTLIQLELRSEIAALRKMRLNPRPLDDLISDITACYEQKINLYQRLIDIASTFIGGPQPGIDYGKLAGEMPKVRAQLEYIDGTLFEATPLIFATLINQRPDSKNHVNHLTITRAERVTLISELTDDFGTKLDRKGQNFTISSARLLKEFLMKYKCSDDPWE